MLIRLIYPIEEQTLNIFVYMKTLGFKKVCSVLYNVKVFISFSYYSL